MAKKQFQKNSKKTNNNIDSSGLEGAVSPRNSLIDKIIMLLYLGVGFVQPMKAFDVSVTQWFYISILNLIVFVYFFLNKKKYPLEFDNKLMKFVFSGALLFVLFSLLSMTQSISLSESVIFMSILLSTLIAFFLLYILLKDSPKKNFTFIVYVIGLYLFIEAIEVINHFAVKNGSKPRSNSLFSGLNPTYGNRNILAASIIIKTSFSFYLIIISKGFKKYIIGLVLFFVGTLSVFLIGARTALYAMPIIVLVLFIGIFIIENNETYLIKIKRYIIPVSLVFVLSFLSSLSFNKIHDGRLNSLNDLIFTKNKDQLYKENKAKTKSSGSIASDSGRKDFWMSAVDGFKTSPFFGVGVGNWKLLEKKVLIKQRKKNSFFYPTRVHNDFLQVLCDIGIFGFLLFASFFGLVYFLSIKNILSKKIDPEIRVISLVLLGGLMAYTMDSLINFPNERPPIQILGFFVIVLSLIFVSNSVKKIRLHQSINIVILVLLLGVIYVKREYFISSKHALVLRSNLLGKNKMTSKYNITYDEMNKALKSFPALSPLGKPLDIDKAYLAYSEAKYDVAMKHLHKAIEISPNSHEHLSFKATMFYSNKEFKNLDSAFYYSKEAFSRRPSLINQYRILKNLYERKKDTLGVINTINTHIQNNPSYEKAWIDKINFYLKYKKDINRAREVRDSAKALYPDKKNIQDLKDFIKTSTKNSNALKLKKYSDLANKLFAAQKYDEAYKQYSKALALNKNNMNIVLNMALVDLRKERYNDAVVKLTKVINSGKVKTGKPEYNRGFSYIKLGKNSLASKDFISSRDKGYALAKKLSKNYFNY